MATTTTKTPAVLQKGNIIATPKANVTAAQVANAVASGFTNYSGGGSSSSSSSSSNTSSYTPEQVKQINASRAAAFDQGLDPYTNLPVNKNPVDIKVTPQNQLPTNLSTGGMVPYEQALTQLQKSQDGTPQERASAISLLNQSYQNAGQSVTPGQEYKTAAALAKQSGIASPQDPGVAMAGTREFMNAIQVPQATPSLVGDIMGTDANFDSILTSYDDFFSPVKQKRSLLDEYKQMSKAVGLEGINAELINAKKIIDGTEDDIRSEITAAGGFATDSQVISMGNARNKSLIKNYNYLLESRDNAMTQLNTMMDLSIEDRKMAENEFDRKLNFGVKVMEFKEKAIDNARQTYLTLGDKMGWDTVLSSASPYEVGLIQKSLGLSSASLSRLANTSAIERQIQRRENAIDLAIKEQQLINTQLIGRKAVGELEGGITTPLTLSKSQGEIKMIDELARSTAISTAVGPSFLSRAAGGLGGVIGRGITGAIGGAVAGGAIGAPLGGIGAIPGAIGGAILGGLGLGSQGVVNKLTGEHQNFIAGVEQLRSNLNLDTLIQAKAEGATFGALSDQELRVLSNAATKLGTYAIKDDGGNVVGYNASEKGFRQELDKINQYAKLDYIMKGGAPEDVGVQVQSDDTLWVQNSDGTFTQLQ